MRSTTWEGVYTQDGRPTEKLINWYRDLAQGGIGLIISGYTFVRPEGKQLSGKMGIYTDDFASDFENLTSAVHYAGGKIAIQLAHASGQADTKTAGQQPLAPSTVRVDQFPEMPAELTKNQINDIITTYGQGRGHVYYQMSGNELIQDAKNLLKYVR